ncbi:glutamate ABC transporter substrate-binding protein [Cryobacterium tagatosivorans]|uniref:Glutamate ABC transporter substrate-binding protein n=1 Tax=Cryobacterium tagatosivorans TaxID=1259199 RepID=A0A4R8UHF0_9MICO|nr:glutamate ABC transporter substrate-binding protein [Cryobacterium tagatosivorans]TFB56013.1 glutamate ABC transporter substrate-binding protein [Cryobacterium tagatosivorans]
MRLNKGLMISAIALASALALSGCTDSGAKPSAAPVETAPEFDAGTTMAKLSDAGKITIGTKFDQPLFGLKGPDGTPEGFDVEMGKLIAAKLGIKAENIEWVETVSANREPFIQNGQVDIVVATYTINDTRKQVVDFAGPYYEAGQDLLVLSGNPDKITGPEDLTGKQVCTVSGSTSEKNIAAYTDKIQATDTYSNCLGPLRSGESVAVTTDNVILAGLADQNEGEFEVIDKPFTKEPYGIGLKKGDDEFRTFINDVLEKSFEDGSWAKAWESTAGKVLETPTPPAVDRY